MKHSKQWLGAVSLSLLIAGSLSACNVAEQPRTETDPGVGLGQVREEPVQERLEELQPGRTVGHYTNQFEQMGYDVHDVSVRDNQVSYDLRRQQERARVTMETQEPARGQQVSMQQRRVEDINVQQYRAGAVGQEQDEATRLVVTEVERLQPGQEPVEYIQQVSEMARVTQYQFDSDDSASIDLETPQGRQYTIDMEVNPQTRRVTHLDIREQFWQL